MVFLYYIVRRHLSALVLMHETAAVHSFADLLVEQRLLLFVVVLQIIFHALNFLLNERVVLWRSLGLVTLQFKLKPLGIAQQFSAVILRLFQLNLDEPLQQWAASLPDVTAMGKHPWFKEGPRLYAAHKTP